MRRSLFSLAPLLLLTLLLANACAPKEQPVPPVPPPAPQGAEEPPVDKGAAIWRAFHDRASGATFLSGPFRISGTLRYTDDKGETTRASSLLWGNGKAANPYPLRMDILAGVGTVVAKAREDERSFLAYVPDEKRAYLMEGEGRTLASFGVPVPLSLGDLTQLLTGLPGALFLPRESGGPNMPGTSATLGTPGSSVALDTPEYVLTGKGARFAVSRVALPGELELSASGVPLAWKETGGAGWSIVFEPGGSNPLQPQKLRVAHPKGYSALITVKEIARVSPPYSREQMGLETPPGTEVERLDP